MGQVAYIEFSAMCLHLYEIEFLLLCTNMAAVGHIVALIHYID